MRSALHREAACSAVHVTRILTDHHVVNVLRALVLERSFHPREKLNRTQIDVLVELETQTQQNALLQNTRLHVRMPNRPEKNRIIATKLLNHRIRKNFSFFQETLTPNIILMQLHPKIILGRNRMKHFYGFTGDFGTSPVSGNSGDFVGLFHVWM
ncbi:MAG: hypothetical protein BWY82_01918 [Verrucomicrobia bacterium ADurb.Bin474]|nr:MAG: hypothetical protein BWY82_01918 [Verrucomicrobia bacterium ADurb.Bin474]